MPYMENVGTKQYDRWRPEHKSQIMGLGEKWVGFNKSVITKYTHERNIEQYFIFCFEIKGFYK